VGRHTRFDRLDGPADRIEFVVAFIYTDRDASGSYDAAIDRFDGLRLDSIGAFAWPD
jgi:hypothetical protein